MFSLSPGTPGRRQHLPRTWSSIFTPADEARYSASMVSSSESELHLNAMCAGRPARWQATSRSMRSSRWERIVPGATRSSRYSVFPE